MISYVEIEILKVHRQPIQYSKFPITKMLVDHQTKQIELNQFICDFKSQSVF